MSDERQFPIMRSYQNRKAMPELPDSIPWTAIAPHEVQAQRNHGGQSIATLAQRGGLSACEAVAVMENRQWAQMDEHEAAKRLNELVAPFKINWQQRAEALGIELRNSVVAHNTCMMNLHAQKQRAERLEKYLQHARGCPMNNKGQAFENVIIVCTCGLDDARKEAV